MENTKKEFNPREHLIKVLKEKDYLPVAWRIYWFREKYPNGTIETEIVILDNDKNYAVVRATVKTGMGGIATGTKREDKAHFGDYLEKAETSSIGRALAALGFGTQFAGEEFDEGERIVDTPQDMKSPNGKSERNSEKVGEKGLLAGMPYDKKIYGYWADSIVAKAAKMNGNLAGICTDLGVKMIDGESLKKISAYLDDKGKGIC